MIRKRCQKYGENKLGLLVKEPLSSWNKNNKKMWAN